MADYSQILACTWGSSTIELESYAVKVEPAVQQGKGRTGTKVTVDLDGYVDGADAAAFAAKVRALHDDLSASARVLTITGVGGAALMTLTAAASLDGGPHARVTSSVPGEVPLRQRVKFSVEADLVLQAGSGSGGDPPLDTYEVHVRTKPDNLKEVERSGELNGVKTADHFLAKTVPAWRAAWPLPGWVVESEYTTNGGGVSKLKYRLTATELFGLLPAVKANKAVDGDASIATETDEQNRKTTTYDLDLLVDGDAFELAQQVRRGILLGAVGFGLGVAGKPNQEDPYYTGGDGTRPGRAAAVPRRFVRERIQITQIRENRVRATFTVVESADGSLLLTWSASMSTSDPANLLDVKKYVGAAPVPVRAVQDLPRVTIGGTAVCEGLYLLPPEPPWPWHAQEPEVTFEYVDRVQRKTTWRYTLFPLNDAGELQKPDLSQGLFYKPAFLDVPAAGKMNFAP